MLLASSTISEICFSNDALFTFSINYVFVTPMHTALHKYWLERVYDHNASILKLPCFMGSIQYLVVWFLIRIKLWVHLHLSKNNFNTEVSMIIAIHIWTRIWTNDDKYEQRTNWRIKTKWIAFENVTAHVTVMKQWNITMPIIHNIY